MKTAGDKTGKGENVEEQGQAATQPEGALNQFQAVEQLTAILEKEEKAQPRDEKGQFTKPEAKAEEAKPEPEAEEEKAEEAKPEEEQPEIKPEPRRFKLKYKGEDKEVDESEIVNLAQQGYDYTQKTQALAKDRSDWETKSKAEQAEAMKKYEQQLEVQRQAVLRFVDPEVLQADLNKLSIEDPARAVQILTRRQHLHGVYGAIVAEQQRVAAQKEAEANTAKQKQLEAAIEEVQKIPGWGAEFYGKILKAAESNGYSAEEAKAITDPKVVKLLDKARQWDEYVAAKPKTVDKRVASVPKVQKPGTAEKSDAKNDRLAKSAARHKEAGTRQSAQEHVLALIEAGRL